MFKNTKIVKLVRIVMILFLLSALSLAGLGFNGMRKMNNNTIKFNERLTETSIVGKLEQDLLAISLSVNNIMNNEYNDASKTVLDEKREIINKRLKDYSAMEFLSSEDKKSLEQFRNLYSNYTASLDNMITDFKKENFISLGKKTELEANSNSLMYILENLSKTTDQEGDDLQVSNRGIYVRSIYQFFIIVFAELALVGAIALSAIKIMQKSIKEINHIVNKLAKGDFAESIHIESTNEFGEMKQHLQTASQNIKALIGDIKSQTDTIKVQVETLSSISTELASSSQQVAAATQNAAADTTEQANSLSKAYLSVENFADKIDIMSTSIVNINENAKSISYKAEQSEGHMQMFGSFALNASKSLENINFMVSKLNANIYKIDTITASINSIAEQTNLLALNASIEAARAGEAGRGFVVVAEEVRKLAEQSREASDTIAKLIANVSIDAKEVSETTQVVTNEVLSQTEKVEDTIYLFKDIVDSIEKITPEIHQISGISEDIRAAKGTLVEQLERSAESAKSLSAIVEEVSASTQEVSTSSESIASAAKELDDITDVTKNAVSKFKI